MDRRKAKLALICGFAASDAARGRFLAAAVGLGTYALVRKIVATPPPLPPPPIPRAIPPPLPYQAR